MIELAAIFNIGGLSLDIIGAVLIFSFGLPEAISRTGDSFLLLEGTDEAEVRKARRFDFWGRVGLCLLIGGFVAQGIGNSTVFW
jgi:hypothetical protein